MHKNTVLLSERPVHSDSGIDVMSEVLNSVHLVTAVFGRLELGYPWRLQVPSRPYLSFYVVTRGSGWLDLPDSENGKKRSISLSTGDAVLIPRGTEHALRDADRSDTTPTQFDYDECPRSKFGTNGRLGGEGPITTLVTGHFTFGSLPRNALLSSLPDAIHLPAHTINSPQLAGVVPLILSESAAPGPGSAIVLARLADLLLIHALRHWIAEKGNSTCGLQAVADPAVGAALRLMHASPAHPWTVDELASAVAMSRSAFSARFTKHVGEPPLHYLARWRITKAAEFLQDEQLSISAVAEQVGYANSAAFTKAFSRLQGVGPGAFRRGKHLAALT